MTHGYGAPGARASERGTHGATGYLAGQQDRAVAAFMRAHELTLPNQFKQLWDNLSSRAAYKKVIDDKLFVAKVNGN